MACGLSLEVSMILRLDPCFFRLSAMRTDQEKLFDVEMLVGAKSLGQQCAHSSTKSELTTYKGDGVPS